MEETNLTAVMHFGSGGFPPQIAPEAPFAVMITLMGTTSMAACTDLLFSPVFHRHPNLKVAFSEGGVGWMPYLIERADYVWRKHKYYQNIHPTIAPSELFRRNISGCFIEDEAGVKNRYDIGVGNITWECDYPHSDSFWPRSRARAEEVFADVPDDEVAQMVEHNTRRWYNFPEAGFKAHNADENNPWRPNGGKGPRGRVRGHGRARWDRRRPEVPGRPLHLEVGVGVAYNAGVERIVQLAQSDWTDQDLLTKDEARQRLVEEIARTRSRLEHIQTDTGDPARIDAEVHPADPSTQRHGVRPRRIRPVERHHMTSAKTLERDPHRHSLEQFGKLTPPSWASSPSASSPSSSPR